MGFAEGKGSWINYMETGWTCRNMRGLELQDFFLPAVARSGNYNICPTSDQ